MLGSLHGSGRLPAALATLALTAVLAPVASAQVTATHQDVQVVTGALTPNCVGGLINDDGTFETSIAFHEDGAAFPLDAVMRFDGPGPGRLIEQVCVCWSRDPGAATSLSHQLVFFAADGPGGEPGTPLGTVNVHTQNMPPQQAMFGYNVAASGIFTPSASFYVGVRWNAGERGEPNHYLCADTNSPAHPTFIAGAGAGDWEDIRDFLPNVDALGVRVELQAPAPPPTCGTGTCVENANTVCLNDGRFEVNVEFDPPNDADTVREIARAERLTGDTGYFTFFDPLNVEAVVKVLDACPVNGHFWVFAGGLTNVETVISICDRARGAFRQYVNPQSTPFQPIQDTAAFATCP